MSVHSDSSANSYSALAKDCKAFYERRLRLTNSVKNKWRLEEAAATNSATAASHHQEFSQLPNQLTKLRSELLSLAHMDNELFKNLLALNDKLEELKIQRDGDSQCSEAKVDEEADDEANGEYDDEDIDEVEQEDDGFSQHYTSLPPSQVLEQAAVAMEVVVPKNCSDSNGGSSLDVMGGLKFMLRSRSFLMRPPFHKKSSNISLPFKTNHFRPPAARRGPPVDPPFKTFDRIQENRIVTDDDHSDNYSKVTMRRNRSQSAERRKGKNNNGGLSNSATLTRGFHLPHSSRSLWQRVFVSGSATAGGGSASANCGQVVYNNNGPESLPCSWSIVDSLGMEDKSPPPTLKHIKQNSFDSGIHTSDSSEYSIKI